MKEFIKASPEGAVLKIHVHTGKAQSKIVGLSEWLNALEIEVCEKPEKGKANSEIEEKLSEFFQAECRIASGKQSRQKTVIARLKPEKILQKLQTLVLDA